MVDDIQSMTESQLGRLEAIESRVDLIERAVKENTVATLEGNRDTREVLEMIQAVRLGFKVLGWLGSAAKWLAGVGGAAAALYTLWHSLGSGKP